MEITFLFSTVIGGDGAGDGPVNLGVRPVEPAIDDIHLLCKGGWVRALDLTWLQGSTHHDGKPSPCLTRITREVHFYFTFFL